MVSPYVFHIATHPTANYGVVPTSSTPKKIARRTDCSLFAKLAIILKRLTTPAHTVINSAPMSPRQLVSPPMSRTILLWVMTLFRCPVSVLCVGMNSGVEDVDCRPGRTQTFRKDQASNVVGEDMFHDYSLQRSLLLLKL